TLKQILLSTRAQFPVVLIITESEVGAGEDFGYSSGFREGLSVKSVLGEEILTHRGTNHIMYLPQKSFIPLIVPPISYSTSLWQRLSPPVTHGLLSFILHLLCADLDSIPLQK